MPLPYGWDHEAIAAKLRVLGAEGYPSKQRYAIAIESARADWKDSHPVHNINQMPAHLKRKKKRTAITNTRRRSANMTSGESGEVWPHREVLKFTVTVELYKYGPNKREAKELIANRIGDFMYPAGLEIVSVGGATNKPSRGG